MFRQLESFADLIASVTLLDPYLLYRQSQRVTLPAEFSVKKPTSPDTRSLAWTDQILIKVKFLISRRLLPLAWSSVGLMACGPHSFPHVQHEIINPRISIRRESLWENRVLKSIGWPIERQIIIIFNIDFIILTHRNKTLTSLIGMLGDDCVFHHVNYRSHQTRICIF